MPKTREFSEKERLEVIKIHLQSYSLRSIGKLLEINHQTIGKIIKKQNYGTIKNLPERGRKLSTN